MDSPSRSDLLASIYHNPSHPASYGSAVNLAKASGVPLPSVLDWLEGQDAFTLHRPIRKRFPRNKYVAFNIDDYWEADLADVSNLATENDNIKFLLVCIDVFSKVVFVRPLASKSAHDVKTAFQDIIESSGRIPMNLRTDSGTEFKNKTLAKYLKSLGIHYFVSHDPEMKCAVVERFNRTLKSKTYKFLTHRNTKRYIDHLQDIVQGYNNAYHRTIMMAPFEVSPENIDKVFFNTHRNQKNLPKRITILKLGTYVRLSILKHKFEKSYEESYTTAVYKIKKILKRRPLVYVLENLLGEELAGTFYRHEMTPVKKPEVFKIDKVLHTVKQGNSRRHYVSWRGYRKEFNSWVDDKELADLT